MSLNLSDNFQHKKPHRENNTMANVVFHVILKLKYNSSDIRFIYNLKQPIQTRQKSYLTLQVCVLFFPPVPAVFSK